ncbi:MAG: hypothetical protein ACETWK_02935 [Candidatus Aminicenantaceae bacterium]
MSFGKSLCCENKYTPIKTSRLSDDVNPGKLCEIQCHPQNQIPIFKKAVESGNMDDMLKHTEAFHAGFERLVRTIRPVVAELDSFHKEMYKLYHYYAPNYELKEIRATVQAMQEKLVPLQKVQLPKRLAERQVDYKTAVNELEAAVTELATIVKVDNKDAILEAVEKVHSAYQKTEHIFD